ncbi:transcription termination factor MTERF4, chloroplastic-like [Phragmites australis]|uniref:transcription termination factor MTERF4, chloroplastic-like n=1 Tax=Phragmites australis TaxID=29695 RepID=UPI002D76982E|nr:transcription termination factor MTERF4, chloroplastic-like [Phragmites australis]
MLLVQKQHVPLSVPPRATVALLSLRQQCRLPTTRLSTTTAAAGSSANRAPFAVEDYLVATCHLTPAQALKASKVLSHLKSPSRPDAVLAFLSGLGLSDTDIAATIAYDPKLLCSEVERTLAPRLAELRDLGLSPSQIARLVLVDPARFRRPTVVSKLQYYVPLFGSFENLLQALKSNSYLLSSDLERVVKPNVTFLMECGLDACDIAKLSLPVPRLLTTNPERVRAMVVRAEAVGVPRGSGMFRHALLAVAFLSEEKIAAKVEFLKKTFRWSDAEVGIAVSKLPLVLKHSKDRLRRMSDFLITQVGLEPEYIAHRPALLTYSLERRLMPRHYVVKFLKANGLLEHDRSYYTAVQVSENVFMEKFICPYKEAAPSLAEDYAAACSGEVPTLFMFQESSMLGLSSV